MKRYRGFEFRRGVESFAHKAASALNLPFKLTVLWKAYVTTAGVTPGGHLYLADVNDDDILTSRDLDKYCGYVLHELCHLAYTDFSYSADREYVRALHNAVEDAFIEHRAIDRKLVGNVSEVFSALLDTMVEQSLREVSNWADPRQYPFVLAVYLRKHATKKVPLADGLQPIFDEAALRLQSAQSSGDTLMIAEWVMSQLNLLNNQDEQDKQDKGDKGDQSGKPEGDSDGQPDDSGEGEAGDKSGDQSGKPQQSAGKAAAPGNHCSPAQVEPQIESTRRGGGGAYSPGFYTCDIDKHQRPHSAYDLGSNVPGKLRYNLKRLFDNSDYSDFQHNRKFGSVNVNALSRHKFSGNVFKLRREVGGIDSAVIICLDVSGSMFSDEPNERRIKMAVQSTAALLETLKFAQVSTSVLTFGGRTAVLKDWHDSMSLAKDRLSKIDEGGSTNDYPCVRYAHERLLMRPEERKVCIVITDGDGDREAMVEQIATAKRLGITTIGIGISLDVSGVYEQCINVNDVADLGTATFKNIKLAA